MLDEVTNRMHYSRAGRPVSWRRRANLWIAGGGLAFLLALQAQAQYVGQVTKKDKETPELRAVAVLEWTGDPGKPKTSRLVPVTVFDGEQLQDGGVYLSRPQPLAVDGGVEYILQKNGQRIGLYDVQSSGQQMGSWVGFGAWKPMPAPKKAVLPPARIDEDDAAGDEPVLHRKHGGDKSDSGSGSGGAGTAPVDPDRPTLHKSSSSEDTGTAPTNDSDRPVLKKGKDSQNADTPAVESLPEVSDPDRPRLMRGKYAGAGPVMTPTLLGLPQDMEQAVAVSDPRNKPEHPWGYTWANPDDEPKMKAQLEDLARTALGIQPPPAPPAPKTKTARAKAKTTLPPVPVPLGDEVFRAFELAYGSGATLVLTAHTVGPLAQQKFVTLIAQPDLYGSLLVLFKNVTDGAHLDDTPRMRLVDAVDAMDDNRGELLFELRGKTQRQFALYRVVRGTADRIFVTSGDEIGVQAMN